MVAQTDPRITAIDWLNRRDRDEIRLSDEFSILASLYPWDHSFYGRRSPRCHARALFNRRNPRPRHAREIGDLLLIQPPRLPESPDQFPDALVACHVSNLTQLRAPGMTDSATAVEIVDTSCHVCYATDMTNTLLTNLIERQRELGEKDEDFALRLKVARSTWTATRLGSLPLSDRIADAVRESFPDLNADAESFLLRRRVAEEVA